MGLQNSLWEKFVALLWADSRAILGKITVSGIPVFKVDGRREEGPEEEGCH